MPWNVPAQLSASVMMPASAPRTLRAIRSTRFDISAAARRENVMSRIRRGSAPLTIRWATRWARVLGLAGSGDDQQRRAHVKISGDAVLHRPPLLGIETIEIGSRCGRE